MSRPVFKGIVFGEGLDLIVFEFGARQDADCVAGAEERDRDHEGAGELEGVALGEGKILRHLRGSILGAGQFPLDGSSKVGLRARSPQRRSRRGRSLLADPFRG